MASADLSKELQCPVCLKIYTNPVTLSCGHTFCWLCVSRVLDSKEGAADYSCPTCRRSYSSRPALQRNVALHNIAESFLSARQDEEDSRLLCTYCAPSPAIMSCLLCGTNLCEDHLTIHPPPPEQRTPEDRNCSVHNKVLACSRPEGAAPVSCLAGGHQEHQKPDEPARKEKLRNDLHKLRAEREKTEETIRNVKERCRKLQEEAAAETERVAALFIDLRRQLDELERSVLREISRQARHLPLSDLIRQLENRKRELCRKMADIEELCHMTGSLSVLQDAEETGEGEREEGDTAERREAERGEGGAEDTERPYLLLCNGGHLDVARISCTFHTGLADIIREVNGGVHIAPPTSILLNVSSAHNNLHISDDRRTVSRALVRQTRPDTADRFLTFAQVLSSRSFSSGRHYWEVTVGASDIWEVGVCYPSIDRRGSDSGIGDNKKSWTLYRNNSRTGVRHDRKVNRVTPGVSSNRVRVDLDYEAGRLSFYDLTVPLRHLHTFTATFSEPLHAAIWLGEASGSLTLLDDLPRLW